VTRHPISTAATVARGRGDRVEREEIHVRLLTIAVVLALALLGAGCGGGDEASSDTETVVTETTDDTTTEDTTTDETTTEDETETDGSSFASGDCAELIAASAQLSSAFGAAGSSGDLEDVSAIFDEFAANAPDEIREDLEILAAAYAEYFDVLSDIDIASGETPSPEALAQLQAAMASIDQAEVTAASERLAAWSTENCPGG
jgi:hypothetical protein